MFHPNTMFHPLAHVRPANIFQADNGLNSIGNTVRPMLEAMDTSHVCTMAKNDFTIFAKNVRGMANDDRLAELEGELQLVNTWSVCVLSETWRKQQQDYYSTKNGNTFMYAGCEAGRRGVGFLVNEEWSSYISDFAPINERVAYLRIVKNNVKLTIIGVYFPHTGYADDTVQEMYDILATIIDEAQRRKDHIIVGGDFNAEIGAHSEQDDAKYVGQFSMGETNSRGAWLKRFCYFKNLTIANTLYPKHERNITTYKGPSSRPRQIDFILIGQKTKRWLKDAGSVDIVNMGSDHRAVKVRMEMSTKRPKKGQRKRNKAVAWTDVNGEVFRTSTEELFRESQLSENLQARCEQVEQVLLQATRMACEGNSEETSEMDATLRDLVEARRPMPSDSAERTNLSKEIQKRIRCLKREKRHRQITATLEAFKGLKRIPDIKSQVRKRYISQMKDKDGVLRTERTSIANIFADFYEQLYSSTSETQQSEETESALVPAFTRPELISAIKGLKSNKCKDTAGIKAEMLKTGGKRLVDVLLDLYNMVVTQTMEIPKSWKHSVITVIYKSGDAMLPQNYRPICIIPLLYKLFSRLLYNRLYPILDKAQSEDQAGFRHKFSTVDHMFVCTMVYEKSQEFQLNIWIAALDFKKAFDSIDQRYLWQALGEQQVPKGYITILRNLYNNQSAQVKTDKMSRKFTIQKGTKQGDPLSSMLFNSLLEKMMSAVKDKISSKKYGIQMGTSDSSRITNLRFADDVLLLGRSLSQVTAMLEEVYVEAQACGLQLHPEKTKIITSTSRAAGRPRNRNIKVGDMKIEILSRETALKYLGRKISFGDYHEDELANRIRAGWAKFSQHKQELTSKHYSLNDRLRLFASVITPTVLYGSECWTVTKMMESALKRTQRKMLRMVLGHGRRLIQASIVEPDSSGEDVQSNASNTVQPEDEPLEDPRDNLEPWVEWIKRVTHHVEERIKRLGIRSWTEEARLRKWKWARDLFVGGHAERWSTKALHWNPQVHFDRPKPAARRRPTRPNLRWLDDIVKITREAPDDAKDEVLGRPDFWTQYQDLYVKVA